ncbi:MAG: hypothetical protein AUK55_08650 [Syntrophobacteraceae bacterium CG2_30_61_12]|nr:MAG: hypothetical protein AUK55_08650 [Syntrophobacteraceae bacterium CG2_30_61_12]
MELIGKFQDQELGRKEMKKAFLVMMALVLAVVLAAPVSAAEFKYGGYWRSRIVSSDNVQDGTDLLDDNYNRIDQRLRMYFYFVASENFRMVTRWEVNTIWGQAATGGDVGADSNNFLMKNVYAEIKIPNTPVTTRIGVQGIDMMGGWLVADDFSAMTMDAKFGAVKLLGGYIAARNEDFTSTEDNIDDVFLGLQYANGPWKGGLYGFYQYARNLNASYVVYTVPTLDNNLFDLGLELGYATKQFDITARGIKNLGSTDDAFGNSGDYKGWMAELVGNVYVNNFTFTLGGFYTSGDDDFSDDDIEAFVYPLGRSHYWSEVLGFGAFGVQDQQAPRGNGWTAGDAPSNLWTVTAGVAWQALEKTKLGFNYYYIGTAEDVTADITNGDTSSEVGNEFDLLIEQRLIDGLRLRMVAGYLVAGDARTNIADDDDAWLLGAKLDWAF